jgi:predicted metalloprotease with PDZ domain
MPAPARRTARFLTVLASAAVAVLPCSGARAASGGAPIRLVVDASEAPRGLLHARLAIPVRAGALTLVYPKWIPGDHAPDGPLVDVAGLRLEAAGKPVAWQRDLDDMFAIHCRVPAGVATLDVALDFLAPQRTGHAVAASTTAQLLVLEWNEVLLYPAGSRTDDVAVVGGLRLPAGWRYGTALAVAQETPEQVTFAPVSLTTLVDSPVLAGAHLRTVDVTPAGGPPHAVVLACDTEAGLETTPELEAGWRRLVTEAGALFGARHYRRYDFLVAMSDHIVHFGLEHHESSDNRVGERTLVDPDLRLAGAGLLPHEFAHSWNGKFRRPADLLAPDFQKPVRTDLLWVYEGLTSYLDVVLAARSGLMTPGQTRDELAATAGGLARQPGRTWRPLLDTAVASQVLWGASSAWSSWRRGADYYGEGVLLWLEADAIIRERSGGRRSLDDFCRRFFGAGVGPGGPRSAGADAPGVVPYTFDDIVKALDDVARYDWRSFFTARLASTAPTPPLGGIEGAGWRLVWADTLNATLRADEEEREQADLRASIGVLVGRDGALADVVKGSAADDAGLAPGMRLLAANGLRFSVDRLREALRAGKNGSGALELIAEQGEFVRTFRLDWHGGELYPALGRDPAKPDRLADILKPLVPPAAGTQGGGP